MGDSLLFRYETNRLIIRDMLPDDTTGMFLLDSDPRVHLYLGNKPVRSIKEVQENIKKIRQQYRKHGTGRWAVIEKETTEFIGWAGIKYETGVQPFPYYDLGYRLRPEFWGRGIATECAAVALQYGFSTLELEQIHAAASVNNIASNKVLLRSGLRFKHLFEFDKETHNWYQIDRREWEAQKNITL